MKRLEGLDFQECDTCKAKSGAPVLCNGCLHNRYAMELLQNRSYIPMCLNCNLELEPVKDSISNSYTGFLWKCLTCSPHAVISIG